MIPESYADLKVKGQPTASPFRPGMSATVDIQTETALNIFTVPIQAVTTRQDSAMKSPDRVDDNDKPAVKSHEVVKEYVFVAKDGEAKLQEVKTGIQDNTNIQIVEGLKEGDEVINGPYRAISKNLKDGDKVKVVDKSALFEKK